MLTRRQSLYFGASMAAVTAVAVTKGCFAFTRPDGGGSGPPAASSLEIAGARGDGSADDSAALQAALDKAGRAGGGVVTASQGRTYRVTRAPVIPDEVKLDLRGATIELEFAAGTESLGIELRNGSEIYGGTVRVRSLGAPRSLNMVHHCNLIVGAADGSLRSYANWRIADLTLENDRRDVVGGTGIIVYAGSNHGVIENIRFPSSPHLGAGIRIHWSGNGGSPAPTASAHPHHVVVRNISFGTMTRKATGDVAGIDIVSCNDIVVSNVSAAQWSGDGLVQIRPGAFGNAVAGPEVRRRFMQGIRVSAVRCQRAVNQLVLVNGRAHGAGPIAAANYPIPAIVEDVVSIGVGANAPADTAGVRILFTSGTTIRNADCSGHLRGLYIEEAAEDITVIGGKFHGNQQSGVMIVHGKVPPRRITLEKVASFDNGKDGRAHAGFYLEACDEVRFVDCVAGATGGENAQMFGFVVHRSARNTRFQGRNRTLGFRAGGRSNLFDVQVAGTPPTG
jgi:hypothetical protein